MKATSADPALVVRALEAYAGELRRVRPEVLAVGYFGSYSRGAQVPGSDLDVLILLRHSPHERFFDRSPDLYPAGFPVGMDIFAYTLPEIERMLEGGNRWIRHIFQETVWIVPPPPDLLPRP